MSDSYALLFLFPNYWLAGIFGGQPANLAIAEKNSGG